MARERRKEGVEGKNGTKERWREAWEKSEICHMVGHAWRAPLGGACIMQNENPTHILEMREARLVQRSQSRADIIQGTRECQMRLCLGALTLKESRRAS